MTEPGHLEELVRESISQLQEIRDRISQQNDNVMGLLAHIREVAK